MIKYERTYFVVVDILVNSLNLSFDGLRPKNQVFKMIINSIGYVIKLSILLVSGHIASNHNAS